MPRRSGDRGPQHFIKTQLPGLNRARHFLLLTLRIWTADGLDFHWWRLSTELDFCLPALQQALTVAAFEEALRKRLRKQLFDRLGEQMGYYDNVVEADQDDPHRKGALDMCSA